jgi:putative ABC transport system substrate-binding protein
MSRIFILVCVLPAVFLPPGSEAQQAGKVPRIGHISLADPATDSWSQGIRRALRDRGYIDGETIAIEYRYTEGRRDRLIEVAAELVRLKVDIIVIAGGDTLLRPVMNSTKTLPIVMMGGGTDPVRAGLVKSLARPGGNVTGLALLSRELGGKRLELLKEAVPKLATVAVLYDPGNRGSELDVKEVLPLAARALGLTLQSWELRGTDDFDKVFAALGKQRPDGLYVPPDMPMRVNEKRIVGFALKSRLPSTYFYPEAVDAGGLMYYGVNVAELSRGVAYYVDRILKGAKPADLPVEQPKKFDFIINLKTAKRIGLTIPPNVLARADRIIQ